MEGASGIFNMIDSQEVSEQELKILRGDAIDNNLYSSSWILNTLISLCELHTKGWSEELEKQLCILWDLSMENDVISFLNLHNFPNIAREILENYTEPRLIEIILGIIGNTFSSYEMIDKIGNDKDIARQILSRLTSDDALILIQLLRILQSVTCRIKKKPHSNWKTHFKECEFFGDCLIFILKSSTNDELLKAAIKLLNAIARIRDIHEDSQNLLKVLFNIDDLMPALLESFMQVIPEGKDSYSYIELNFIKLWLQILIAIMNLKLSAFINYYGSNENILKSIMEIMFRILQPYKESHNLFPIIEDLNMDVIRKVFCILMSFRYFDMNIQPRLDFLAAHILFSLKRTEQQEHPLKPTFRKFMKAYWLQINKHCTQEYIADLLNQCEEDLRVYITIILNYYSTRERQILEVEKELEEMIANFQNL